MKNHFIVYGSWKIRHNEPLGENEGRLVYVPLSDHVVPEDHSLLLDLQGLTDRRLRIQDGEMIEHRVVVMPDLGNLSEGPIPLAAVTFGEGGTLVVTHLLSRLELHVTHLIRVPGLPAVISPDPVAGLVEAFQKSYILLNNFECLYVKGMPDTELEQKFTITENYHYYSLNRNWYRDLDRGIVPGFAPQLGDEIQHWSYDNNFCQILPNPKKISGYVSIMYWSKKKTARWDEPSVTYKKKMFKEDALERWERNYADQVVQGTPEQSMAAFFDLPLESLPDWRRTRLDIACEALSTGNIFMVNFEDTRIRDRETPDARLQQCEIEYLKTRGIPDETQIRIDFATLTQRVEEFMAREGLSFKRTNYSKLTFLKDFTAITETS